MPETALNVVLLRYTPEPEEVVAMAAKLCYSPSGVEELKEKIEAKDQAAFVEKLASIGHLSPIEHVSFSFGIEGISRACSHQLVRHRVASFSQQSQRYVKEEQFDYVIPPSIKQDPVLNREFEKFMAEAQDLFNTPCHNFPSSNISVPAQVGQITSAGTGWAQDTERTVNFKLRFNF